MTRIIAGFAGSLILDVPRKGTRPTSDRVREAIFSALQARDLLNGARVLDLYAGTGALGLEAASRGAETIALVERTRETAKIARKNGARVARAAPEYQKPFIRTYPQSARSFLEQYRGTWDLVFLDPPYVLAASTLTEILELLLAQLTPKAYVLVERDAKEDQSFWPAGFSLENRVSYGDTVIFWLRNGVE